MKAAKARREQLFRAGKPTIRPVVYDDIRWMWVGIRRTGADVTPEEFTRRVEPYLSSADKLFMLEDRNAEFATGQGPVGVVLANYDEWTLVPHVEWFPWANPRNKLRCTVGFLQAMRYTHDVGCIKIFATAENAKWFKWLKRYTSIILAGRIPGGRASGEEYIFYLRGRKQNGRRIRLPVRRGQDDFRTTDISHTQTAGSSP